MATHIAGQTAFARKGFDTTRLTEDIFPVIPFSQPFGSLAVSCLESKLLRQDVPNLQGARPLRPRQLRSASTESLPGNNRCGLAISSSILLIVLRGRNLQ